MKDTSFYILMEDGNDPSIRYIVGQFSHRGDTEHFTSDVGGEIVMLADGGDVPELVKAWKQFDFSQAAHSRAREMLAEFREGFTVIAPDDLAAEADAALIAGYADTDPMCAMALRVRKLLIEAKATIDQVIPLRVETFQGAQPEESRLSEEAKEAMTEALEA